MIIREYKPEDREQIEKCIFELQEGEHRLNPEDQAGGEVSSAYYDYLVKWVSGNNGKIFVAETDGSVVGFVAIAINEDKDPSPCSLINKFGYVTDLVVLPGNREKGVGEVLMQAAEKYTKECGVDYISLHLSKGNRAENFYKKLGYVEYTKNLKKKLA